MTVKSRKKDPGILQPNEWYIDTFQSPLGWLSISVTETGLSRLDIRQKSSPAPQQLPPTPRQLKWIKLIRRQLDEYFKRQRTQFEVPLDIRSGTDFQRLVWKALSRIPYGKTVSYLDIANRTGHPKSYRAVGQANGSNPIPILIPCHRVISADGTLGGYSCGIEVKQILLTLEGIHV